jgi:hypothetical protein
MTPKGGHREGAGRKPALLAGERKHFYLAPDLVQWWDCLPEREKSAEINQAIRNAIALEKLLHSDEQTPEKREAILTNQMLRMA